MIQRIILCVLVTSLYYSFSFSQNCNGSFINKLKIAYSDKKESFEKIVSRSLKENAEKFSDVQNGLTQFYFPVIFSTRKAEDASRKNNLLKDSLLCYLDGSNIEFEDAILLSDTALYGSVIRYRDSKSRGTFLDSADVYTTFRKPLVEKLLELNPEIVFTVYNLANTYWYIKEDELYVITYRNTVREMSELKIFTADEYINTILINDDILYLSSKRVEVF
jgi:hypothetical protein